MKRNREGDDHECMAWLLQSFCELLASFIEKCPVSFLHVLGDKGRRGVTQCCAVCAKGNTRNASVRGATPPPRNWKLNEAVGLKI